MGRKQKGLLYALAAAFFFCFTEVCMKKIGGQLGGIQVTFSRYILAGILLLPLARRELRRRHTSVSLAQFWEMNLLGLWGVVLVAPFYQTGTVMLGAGISSVLFSINPLCVALMAALLLGEPVRLRQKQGLALQVIAIFVLVNPLESYLDPVGLLILFLSVFFYSLYAVRGRRLSSELGSLVMTCGGFLCGGVQTAILAGLTHISTVSFFLRQHDLAAFADIPFFTGYTWDNLPWVLLLYIGVTIFAFLCWFYAMDCGGTALGNLTYFFKPILSPLLAIVFVGETITGRMLCGMGLMLAGALVCLLPEKNKGNKAESLADHA